MNVDAYLGEVRMFGGSFAPQGWALCQGQIVPINQNEALFTLIGTTYGGDGVTTFGLPDLQGRLPVHNGTGPGGLTPVVLGQKAGTETVTFTTANMPAHTHNVNAVNIAGGTGTPGTSTFIANSGKDAYVAGSTTPALTPFNTVSVGTAHVGVQVQSIIQPVLAIQFIIALNGIYPSPN
jgi:microcystin-dependent protein